MPRYSYLAKSQPQKTIQGSIEAESEADAINKLTSIGYFPVSLKREDLSSLKSRFFVPWNFQREITLFTRQLATLIHSGVNILESLSIIAKQTPHKHFKSVLSDIISKIKDGQSLSESMKGYLGIFSPLYTSMLHSGEVSGNIDVVLGRLADFMEKEQEFKDAIRMALIYPAFVLAVGIITVTVLLGFVIPKLVTMFEGMGQVLPLPTRILINTSDFVRAWWWLICAIIGIGILLVQRSYRLAGMRIFWDRLKIKLAVFGQFILKSEISRLMRTLSLLISSGLPIVYSLDIAGNALGNQVLKMELQKFKEKINRGASFSSCLQESKLFPIFVENIVRVGEESGALDKSLARLGDDYEKEVDRSVKTLTRVLEPVIILAMGLIVGFIVISLLLPIFELNLIAR